MSGIIRPKRFQGTLKVDQIEKMLKYALEAMRRDSYDFRYTSKSTLRHSKCKEMLRSVYLRFSCKTCKKTDSEKPKVWTTSCGTFGIKFVLQPIEEDRRDPYLLIFEPHIYGMKCFECEQYGEVEIYNYQMERIEQQFVKIVSKILNKVPPRHRSKNHYLMQVPDLVDHKTKLCEACSVHKCQASSHLIDKN